MTSSLLLASSRTLRQHPGVPMPMSLLQWVSMGTRSGIPPSKTRRLLGTSSLFLSQELVVTRRLLMHSQQSRRLASTIAAAISESEVVRLTSRICTRWISSAACDHSIQHGPSSPLVLPSLQQQRGGGATKLLMSWYTTTHDDHCHYELDASTVHRIKQDLHDATRTLAGDDDNNKHGGRIGFEELQQLLLLYPQSFSKHDAETIGELFYVGRNNGGEPVCELTFLRALQYVARQHQHDQQHSVLDELDDNHHDYGKSSASPVSSPEIVAYLESFTPRHPIRLQSLAADACWGGSQWSEKPYTNLQEQFDTYLWKYYQAAYHRAHHADAASPDAFDYNNKSNHSKDDDDRNNEDVA